MTETLDAQSITEALSLIDEGLGGLTSRNLVPSDEMADLLLDVRALLAVTASSSIAPAATPVAAN